jgi:hypothetical protein
MAFTIEVAQKLVEASRQVSLGSKRGTKKDMDGEAVLALIMAESVLATWKSVVYDKAEKLAEMKFEAAKEASTFVGVEFPMTKKEFISKSMESAEDLKEELEAIVEEYKG